MKGKKHRGIPLHGLHGSSIVLFYLFTTDLQRRRKKSFIPSTAGRCGAGNGSGEVEDEQEVVAAVVQQQQQREEEEVAARQKTSRARTRVARRSGVDPIKLFTSVIYEFS